MSKANKITFHVKKEISLLGINDATMLSVDALINSLTVKYPEYQFETKSKFRKEVSSVLEELLVSTSPKTLVPIIFHSYMS
jgi:hypothetical protein